MNKILSFKLNKYLITIIQEYNINILKQNILKELYDKIWWIASNYRYYEIINMKNIKITRNEKYEFWLYQTIE